MYNIRWCIYDLVRVWVVYIFKNLLNNLFYGVVDVIVDYGVIFIIWFD